MAHPTNQGPCLQYRIKNNKPDVNVFGLGFKLRIKTFHGSQNWNTRLVTYEAKLRVKITLIFSFSAIRAISLFLTNHIYRLAIREGQKIEICSDLFDHADLFVLRYE